MEFSFDDANSGEESTIAILNDVSMFKVPPLSSATGYKANDWNGQHFMTGGIMIAARGSTLYIKLRDNSGKIVAETAVGDKTVMATIDSSRYYVLAMKDPKGHTRFLGIGFTKESNNAVEFIEVLGKHKRQQDELKQLKASERKFADLSLKEGETIHINIKAGELDYSGEPKKVAPVTKTPSNSLDVAGADIPIGSISIAPPPQAKHRRQLSHTSPVTTVSASPTEEKSQSKQTPSPKSTVEGIPIVQKPQDTFNPFLPPGGSMSPHHISEAPTPKNSVESFNPFLHSDDPPTFATTSSSSSPAPSAGSTTWVKF